MTKHVTSQDIVDQRYASTYLFTGVKMPKEAALEYMRRPGVLDKELRTLGEIAVLQGKDWPPKEGTEQGMRYDNLLSIMGAANAVDQLDDNFTGHSSRDIQEASDAPLLDNRGKL